VDFSGAYWVMQDSKELPDSVSENQTTHLNFVRSDLALCSTLADLAKNKLTVGDKKDAQKLLERRAFELVLCTWLHFVASLNRFVFRRPASTLPLRRCAHSHPPDLANRQSRRRLGVSRLRLFLKLRALIPAPSVVSPTAAAEQNHNEKNDQ
jgi:hypothetical protein